MSGYFGLDGNGSRPRLERPLADLIAHAVTASDPVPAGESHRAAARAQLVI